MIRFKLILTASMVTTMIFAVILISSVAFSDGICLYPLTVFHRKDTVSYSLYTLSDGRTFWSDDLLATGDRVCLK